MDASSPYSPSPYTGKGQEGIKSPTLSTAAHASSQRLRSTLGVSHKRSSSELLASKSASIDFRRDKDKSSNAVNSNAAAKLPASLSPRRPKLSIPSVSTESALARNAVDIVDAGSAGEAAGDSSFASSLDESPTNRIVNDKDSRARIALDEPRRGGESSRLAWNMFERPLTTDPEPHSVPDANPPVPPRRSLTLRHQNSRVHQRASLDVMSVPRRGASTADVAPRQSLAPTAHVSSQPGGGVGLNAASRMIRSLGKGAGRRLSAQIDTEREGFPSSPAGVSPND